MEIETLIQRPMFIDKKTVEKWQEFWKHLCDMAYYRTGIVEKMIVLPKDNQIVLTSNFKNEQDILFNTVWKTYSSNLNAQQVPELKELYVPCDLFVCPGVWGFMNYCFPNCKITFWE